VARPRSEDKRRAILAGATRMMMREGLGASTVDIAREAGVPHGSVFTYFDTKAGLWNAVYVELKQEMAGAALEGFSTEGAPQNQFAGVWWNWMDWGVAHVGERRALALLEVSDEVTAASRAEGEKAMGAMGGLVDRIHAQGGMRALPMEFLVAMMHAAAETTMDFMVGDGVNREKVCRAGFDAVWRMIG
jgi:AcrR family transcriptional regulator